MKVFNKGQVVIPSELRKRYGIKIGDTLDVVTEEGMIKLIPNRGEQLTKKLFGIFAEYRKGKPELNKQLIIKATGEGFTEERK